MNRPRMTALVREVRSRLDRDGSRPSGRMDLPHVWPRPGIPPACGSSTSSRPQRSVHGEGGHHENHTGPLQSLVHSRDDVEKEEEMLTKTHPIRRSLDALGAGQLSSSRVAFQCSAMAKNPMREA